MLNENKLCTLFVFKKYALPCSKFNGLSSYIKYISGGLHDFNGIIILKSLGSFIAVVSLCGGK